MKLIVGLGNFGKKYENTRHNTGFIVLDNYLKSLNLECKLKKFNGLSCDGIINSTKVIFLKPLSFMNNSGIVIKKYMDYYNIKKDDVLVIYDDLDLEVGSFKLKLSGGTAGHNGLKSIEENLNTKEYKRLKIGISKNTYDKADYVLSRFSNEQIEILNTIMNTTNSILSDFFDMTFENLMNKYN